MASRSGNSSGGSGEAWMEMAEAWSLEPGHSSMGRPNPSSQAVPPGTVPDCWLDGGKAAEGQRDGILAVQATLQASAGKLVVFSLQFTVYSKHYTVYSMGYTVQSGQLNVRNVQCSVFCTVPSVM